MSDPGQTSIEVLREMVRLAENRRAEEFESLERMNKYNFALVGFSGSFLALLLTVHAARSVVQAAGLFLLISILTSLMALQPRIVKGGVLTIDDDVEAVKHGHILNFHAYLLDVAEFTDQAGQHAAIVAKEKKRLTIFAAIFLAIALLVTYALIAYA